MSLSSSSSSSATVAVEKATSDLLMGPDWTMNIDICDSINSYHWQAKDVVKAIKKRLQHKNSKVQLLSLTLLETMVKNCGDYVHLQIAERNILGEMIKIVKKKADMHVRDKILVLLDSWQEAFGGSGGKYPQYYWAYDELRRSGVEFPKRSIDAAPIFTPPASNSTLRHTQASYGMPSNSARRLDETMATEVEGLSSSSMDSMQNIVELLGDMLQAVNPSDSAAIKDEVIVDLVNRCRAEQKKLMQMLTTTGDEELLGRGLELNDSMQNVLAKHDAIASGSPLPNQVANMSPRLTETYPSSIKQTEIRDPSRKDYSPRVNADSSLPIVAVTRSQIDDEEEEEDEFAQLARRHSKVQQPTPGQSSSSGIGESSSIPLASLTSSTCTALALPDPPAPVKTKGEQDMIDLLSITLSTASVSPHTPPSSNQNMHQLPVSPVTQPPTSAVPYNSYVVPWAQPQPMQQRQPHIQPQIQTQQQFGQQPQLQFSSGYPPPPWAASSVYLNQSNNTTGPNMFLTPRANGNSASTQVGRPLQHYNSFPSRGMGGPAMLGDLQVDLGPINQTPAAPTQKPFVPSYRLFEDLNVFGNADTRLKMSSSSTTSSMGGAAGQSMLSGRK